MDAETEVGPTRMETDNVDNDDGLDKLLRKAVTVSQTNLPMATIDKDIDDIASACAKENERKDSALDEEFVRLLERTRQRREMLDQKMGKGPEAVPRKRRSPLTEDLTSNVGDRAGQSEDSPKRQCVRDKESSVKPDTPAIASVRSRLQALSAQRAHWDEKGAENQGEASPVPTPRKSVALSPPPPATSVDPPATGSQRKSRFAQLASNISNWEDDLSHPTIVKEEEKKPRWQPPKATDSCGQSSQDSVPGPSCAGSKSPRKAATGPQSAQTALALPVKAVADENHAEKSTPSEDRKMEGENEKDDQLGKKVNIETLSKEGGQAKEEDEDAEMNKETDSTRTEETTTKRVLKSNLPKKGETAKPLALSTTDQPLSTRLANWEQKISDSKSDAPCTPKTTAAAATPGKMTLKKDSTPAHPVSTAAAAVEEHVQLRPKARRGTEDEPTAHPVSARMSAWEQISTAQVVTNIKKVQPGESTPAKLLPAGQKSPAKNVPGTPGIKERIAQLGTPQKASGGTPGKGVGSSSKSVQWQPAQQSQSSSMAQRLRQERMAELEGIQNRWKNGVLQEGAQGQAQQPPEVESSANLSDKRQGMQEKARAGLDDASDPAQTKGREETSSKSTTSGNSSGGGIVTGKPPRPTSLFTIVSQQKAEAAATAAASPKTSISSTTSRKACRKVKFDDSFDDEDSHLPLRPRTQLLMPEPVAEEEEGNPEDGGAEDEVEVVLRRPRPSSQQQQKQEEERYDDDDDDDVSLSAFVPRSVRFESVARSGQDLDSSLDSLEGAPGAPPDFHKSTVDLVKLGQQYGAYSDSDEDTTHTVGHCAASRHSASQSQSSTHPASTSGDLEESIDDRDAIGDLLDQAMESEGEGEKKEEGGPSTSAQPEEEEEAPVPVMRKKKPREASARGDLPFSINEYRASRNLQIQEVKQTIVRNSQYVGKVIREEDVQMPSPVPSPAPPRSLSDRIKELQELVQQEQSVIMQTSNALNQCCNSSHFAGSSEQVECNRILLLSCQKRQAYLTEIQRLKNSGVLDPSGPGPKGSLTISDIRLPLKKDFVTKIATLQDTMTYYFIVLLRRGAQVISTQMLSTHDPMMSGSLDFPNLIKLNNITDQFQLTLEIYCMSVSCEAAGKDKKKKTPKKMKGLTVQSPGGPLAVRTTSFSQVTTVPLTMKCVDKHSFTLHRLPHLSPLHGTIYMKLKCLMEANVEEKGFLTMFEDVSGLGSWHRRWCVLGASRLQFWKYPDDETRKEPIGSIELKRCVTEKVGLISRDVCARPNTFELTTVRQPQKGEKDTLVTTTHTTVTTVRHMLSADTKEERIVWCNKVNRALATLRTWHADAMRPLAK